MADTVVFLGPTLSAAEARTYLDAFYLPPIGRGDVVRAVEQYAPLGIVIIDGAFGQRPAVRHKEILWALARGVQVYGAASMGAIRAAELADYGMVGHGFVFRWYRRTMLADDADVAVGMAPQGLGSYALGEALIDIRLTLKKAERMGVICRQFRMSLEEAARSIYFTERTYANLLSSLGVEDEKEEIGLFRKWLSEGAVKQKKSDAISLLEFVSRNRNEDQRPANLINFEMTEAFATDMEWDGLSAVTHTERR